MDIVATRTGKRIRRRARLAKALKARGSCGRRGSRGWAIVRHGPVRRRLPALRVSNHAAVAGQQQVPVTGWPGRNPAEAVRCP